ncbi:MAG: tetratricopeptide repeat protein [Acidobacteria bacterium]|nr:tetratricopeptide repeat protein [Acidobacteriota bacterium]
MRGLLILMLLYAPVQSDREFKTFFAEGKALYEQGNYEEAVSKFREALRLNGKPQKVKVEGTFFEPYQPRYWLALSLEHVDVEEAADWVDQSQQAGEGDVDKNRNLVAKYNNDCQRIKDAAATAKMHRIAQIRIQLDEAERLLNENRFDEAKAKYQSVLEKFPDNADAYAGIQKVSVSKSGYIDSRSLAAKLAISEKKYQEAETLISDIERTDHKHPSISELRAQLTQAQSTPQLAIVDQKPPTKTQSKPPETKPTTHQAQQPSEPIKTQAQVDEPPDKTAIRTALLATITPYKQGNPKGALQMLDSIELEGVDKFGSYHWLRGLYLLTIHYQRHDHNQEVLEEGLASLKQALSINPGFQPDPATVPNYVLESIANIRELAPQE